MKNLAITVVVLIGLLAVGAYIWVQYDVTLEKKSPGKAEKAPVEQNTEPPIPKGSSTSSTYTVTVIASTTEPLISKGSLGIDIELNGYKYGKLLGYFLILDRENSELEVNLLLSLACYTTSMKPIEQSQQLKLTIHLPPKDTLCPVIEKYSSVSRGLGLQPTGDILLDIYVNETYVLSTKIPVPANP